MYICPNHNTVFIHINKTGGRSAVKFMRDNIPGFYCVGLHLVHKSYETIKRLIFGDQRILSIVRNPFERYESLYSYRRQKWANGNKAQQNVDAVTLPFDAWMWNMLASDEILDSPQQDWLPFGHQDLYLLRLEHLQEDLCAAFKIQNDSPITPVVPHLNKSRRRPVEWPKELRWALIAREEWLFQNLYIEEVPL
ncbi:MAG: sulfotransferase family 2 domain-containing protein [Planctomycetota bacterium]|jgi:hypothetical protein